MAKNDDRLREIRAGNFVENNGIVLRNINILRHKYIELKSVRQVRQVQKEMTEQEFLDCVNYLQQEGYISLRDIDTKDETSLADADYKELEALVSSRGIKLLGGFIQDEAVDV